MVHYSLRLAVVLLAESIVHQYVCGTFYFFVDLVPGAAVCQGSSDVGTNSWSPCTFEDIKIYYKSTFSNAHKEEERIMKQIVGEKKSQTH